MVACGGDGFCFCRFAFFASKICKYHTQETVSYTHLFRGVTVVADTIAYTGDLKDGKQNKYKVRDAKNTSLVGFKVVDGEGYEIVALNTNKSLAVVNGTVIFSNTVAPQVFTLDAAEAPTANEGVEVSEVKVIATEGGVQIVGATGKLSLIHI